MQILILLVIVCFVSLLVGGATVELSRWLIGMYRSKPMPRMFFGYLGWLVTFLAISFLMFVGVKLLC